MLSMLILLAAAAQDAAVPPPPPAPATEVQEVKVTCRTERVTGTRMVKRTCRTPQQQQQADVDARNKLRLGTQVQTTEAFKAPSGQ